MTDDGNPDDATLVMALDPKQTDAWRALVELDEDPMPSVWQRRSSDRSGSGTGTSARP